MPNLAAPIANPRPLPGTRHAPTPTREEMDALAAVRAGDQFTYRGDHYLATADATDSTVTHESNGCTVRRVFVQACATNPAMPSGWQLADVMASRVIARDGKPDSDYAAEAPKPARVAIPRELRRLIQVNYREAHAHNGYGRGAHGRINERAHIVELLGDSVEAGRVAIKWNGTSYCDAPGGIACASESIIRVPSLANPQRFWDLIDSSDPWIEGSANWHAAPPSTASAITRRIAAERESGE